MPIKSKAQRRKFAELLVEGKIDPDTYERWNREAGSAELPERVRPKSAKASAKRKSARTSARKNGAEGAKKRAKKRATKRAKKARKR